MFDFLRNLTKSAADKRRERLHAYVDDALPARQRAVFEQELAQDSALQAEAEQMQALKMQLRQMPRQPVPRSFTLDPAKYGRPRTQPLFQAYPALRVATVLTAFFLVLAIGLEFFSMPLLGSIDMQSETAQLAEPAAMDEATAPEPRVMQEGGAVGETAVTSENAVEVTRVVTEAETAVEVAAEEEAGATDAPSESMSDLQATGAPTLRPAEADDAEISESVAADGIALTATVSPTPTPSATPSPKPTATLYPTATATKLPPLAEPAAIADTSGESQDNGDADTHTGIGPQADNPLGFLADIGGWRWVQIGLFVLVLMLTSLTVYVRRRL